MNDEISLAYASSVKGYLLNKSVPELVYIDIKPIKGFKKKYVFDRIIQIVQDAQAEVRVIMASSDLLQLRRVHRSNPGIRTALEGFNAGKEWIHFLIPPSWRPDYYSGFARHVNERHIKWLQKHDLLDQRIVYNVDGRNFAQLRDAGMQCMIIDYDRYLDPVLYAQAAKADSILKPSPNH